MRLTTTEDSLVRCYGEVVEFNASTIDCNRQQMEKKMGDTQPASVARNLKADFERECKETKQKKVSKVSKTDARVLDRPFMETDCPKKSKKKICVCNDLLLFSDNPVETQTSIRQLYLRAVSEGGHKDGNQFLLGCMENPKRSASSFLYKVPFIKGQKCRIFKLCVKQFMTLFGLTESRLDRLRKQK